MRNTQVVAINICNPPLSKLNESVTKAHTRCSGVQCKIPAAIIIAGSWVVLAIVSVYLCGLSVFMRNTHVGAINICDPPLSKLNESVPKTHTRCSGVQCTIPAAKIIAGSFMELARV